MSEKRSVNLCSTYILPLLGLNKWSFGLPERFVNSYVNEDDSHIVVECTHPYSATITQHANFKFSFERDNNHFAVFEAPVGYKEDIQKFRDGKYSLFSDKAKDLIRKRSGLSYKVPIPGKGGFKSALELLALDKDKELKKYWEKMLSTWEDHPGSGSVVKLDDDAELASIPGQDNFFELKLSTQLETLL